MNIPQKFDLILHNTLETFHIYHAAEVTVSLTMHIMMDILKATNLQYKIQWRNLKQQGDAQVHVRQMQTL